MQTDGFADQIEAVYERLRRCMQRDRITELQQKIDSLPLLPPNLLEAAFEEASTVLEELQVVQEGLFQQHEKLVAARQAAETQRQRYQELFDFAPDAYLVTDVNGTIQEANCAATTLLNSSQKSLVGKPLISFVALEDRPTFRVQLNELCQQVGSVCEWQLRLYPRNSEALDAALRVGAFQDRGGKQISLRWLVRDVTVGQQAQAQRLRESENRWQTIVETEPECVKLVACDGTLLDMNPAGLAIIEAESPDAVIGQSVYSLIAPEHQEAFMALNERVCQGNRGTLEFELIGLRGNRRWLETYAVPLRSESDGTLVQLAITRDITARKQAEEALKQAKQELETRVEERTAQLRTTNEQLLSEIAERKRVQGELERSLSLLRGTLEATADGIIVSQNGRYIETVNQKFVEMWRIPESAIASGEVSQILPSILEQLKDPEPFLSETEGLLSQANAEAYGIYELKDGRTFERYSLPQRIGGNIVGRVCSFRDITERKQAEEALKRVKDGLEIKVQERTALLRQAIEQLQSEIEERKIAQEELQCSEARFREVAHREALLNRFASLIRNSLDLDTILETAVQELYSRLAIDVSLFAWYRKDGTTCGWEVVKEAKNSNLPNFGGMYRLEKWRPFTCKLVNQQACQIDTVTEKDCAMQQMLLPYGTAAMLSLPIHTQSGTLGAITCGRLVDECVWTDGELEMLQAVANQLAIAINQAQLYEQSRSAANIAQTKATELEIALCELQHTQAKLIQSEKMSSLGQLIAGVAHEINNPLNFIHGNLTHLTEYSRDLFELVQLYQNYYPDPVSEIRAYTEVIDLDFIKEDLPKILSSMQMGAERIREIVLSLRHFSHIDEAQMKRANIHEGLDNTLLILTHRLKATATRPAIQVIKEYGNLPLVECYAGQLNQVFMNVINNAIDSIEEYNQEQTKAGIQNNPGSIWIRTDVLHNHSVIIRIADNGKGMTEEVRQRLFDPFFTTKPVGSGTGLGMSISYRIVEKHNGQLMCNSVPGKGAEFLIQIPIHQRHKLPNNSVQVS